MSKLSSKDKKTLNMAASIVRANVKSRKQGRMLASGLESLVGDLTGGSIYTPQINKPETIQLNLRRYPFTFDRPTLTYLYVEYGIIRTAIDLPIDDALRGGVDFESDELSPDDIKKLTHYMESQEVYNVVKATMRWGRLFGGAGTIINNGQDSSTRLDLKSMDEKSPLALYDADRWELSMPNDEKRPEQVPITGDLYYYYGRPIHRSRVLTVKGDSAPSFVRRMLMGWGLSEIDKMVRDLNQYIKAVDVIFELLDEAKIDVYRLQGYHTALARPAGQAKMTKAIGLTNSLKNFLNAVVIDKDDEYLQKQLSFSGLAEMMKEIRIGMASTEEDMKVKKQTRMLNNYDRGLTTAKETMEAQRTDGLLAIEKTAVEEGLTEDFPTPPIEKVTSTLKREELNPAEKEQ